jgi:hypothetical protein
MSTGVPGDRVSYSLVVYWAGDLQIGYMRAAQRLAAHPPAQFITTQKSGGDCSGVQVRLTGSLPIFNKHFNRKQKSRRGNNLEYNDDSAGRESAEVIGGWFAVMGKTQHQPDGGFHTQPAHKFLTGFGECGLFMDYRGDCFPGLTFDKQDDRVPIQ